jgi:hypothetical protein
MTNGLYHIYHAVTPFRSAWENIGASVPAEFTKWVYGDGVKMPGLVNRPEAECKLFLGS